MLIQIIQTPSSSSFQLPKRREAKWHCSRPPLTRRCIQTQIAASLNNGPDRIGSEYGEGFMQFRISGEKIHLDVETLNEQLKVKGADRIRHATMRPDEAFGLIFAFDDVIVSSREVRDKAWRKVAEQENLPMPTVERPQMYDLQPERAIIDILQWTRNWGRAQELAWLVAVTYNDLIKEIDAALPGVMEWLDLIGKTNVPSALVTGMDKVSTTSLLEKLSLRRYFTDMVTADDDMETRSQQFLSAAIKIGRPPNQCVVFASDHSAVAAAHNCTMRAVAIIGAHPAYRLRNADLTIASMNELSVVNIRRLFANRGSEFMDLNKKFVGVPPRPSPRIANSTSDDEPEDEPKGVKRKV